MTPLDLERALRNVGLELALKDEEETEERGDSVAYLGLNLKGNIVATVLSDGPAYQAGVMAGDEILSIDKRRLSAGTLIDRLEELDPGQEIDEDASSEHKKAFERWTHQAWSN